MCSRVESESDSVFNPFTHPWPPPSPPGWPRSQSPPSPAGPGTCPRRASERRSRGRWRAARRGRGDHHLSRSPRWCPSGPEGWTRLKEVRKVEEGGEAGSSFLLMYWIKEGLIIHYLLRDVAVWPSWVCLDLMSLALMLAPTMWELRRSPTLNIRHSLSSLREMTACLEKTSVSARLLGCEIFTNIQPTWRREEERERRSRLSLFIFIFSTDCYFQFPMFLNSGDTWINLRLDHFNTQQPTFPSVARMACFQLRKHA